MRRSAIADEIDRCRQADAERTAAGTQDASLNGQCVQKPRSWQDELLNASRLKSQKRLVRDAFTAAWRWMNVRDK
jgi:hypothetical protein